MKCPHCNSCIGRTVTDNQLFIYCKLCLKVWRLVKGSSLQEVEIELKNKILKQLNLSRID